MNKYFHKHDAEIYELTIVTKPDADGAPQKVYELKNAIHFWSGTESEFRNAFEKV